LDEPHGAETLYLVDHDDVYQQRSQHTELKRAIKHRQLQKSVAEVSNHFRNGLLAGNSMR